jgi:hypothetical protein
LVLNLDENVGLWYIDWSILYFPAARPYQNQT